MTADEYDRAETIRLLMNELILSGCYSTRTVITEEMIQEFTARQIKRFAARAERQG